MQKRQHLLVVVTLFGTLASHFASAYNPQGLIPAQTHVCPSQENKPLWCIVGGSRGAGYALAQNLCNDSSVSCTLFVRPDSTAKVRRLMASTKTPPKIAEGDVTTQLDKLMAAAQGARYLVIAQTFPYALWEESFKAMVAHCIAAARSTGATLIYYGRTQRYGLINPITETSKPQPDTLQGKVMDEAEKYLEECSTPAIIIHHSYPFGYNSGDGLLDKNFSGIPHNKGKAWYQAKQKFDWVGSDTVKMQVTYLPDLAQFTRQLVSSLPLKRSTSFTVNFAGITLNSINDLGAAYCSLAGQPYELNLYSKNKLMAASFMTPEARWAIDSYDSFIHETLINNAFQESLCPFNLTSLEDALRQTHAAYASHAAAQ